MSLIGDPVRDFSGRIIGFYEHKPNGDIIVREFSGRILGYYRASENVTTDFYGRKIAFVNVVGMLFR